MGKIHRAFLIHSWISLSLRLKLSLAVLRLTMNLPRLLLLQKCVNPRKVNRVGGALQSPSSHTTVQALLHTAVPTKCLTTIPTAFSS